MIDKTLKVMEDWNGMMVSKDFLASWRDPEIQKQLKDLDIIYDGVGVHAIRIYRKKFSAPVFEIGIEDDDVISFHGNNVFSSYWTQSLIDTLNKAMDAVNGECENCEIMTRL